MPVADHRRDRGRRLERTGISGGEMTRNRAVGQHATARGKSGEKQHDTYDLPDGHWPEIEAPLKRQRTGKRRSRQRVSEMTGKASNNIGWIGLGRMGEAMAARLVKAGHGLSVWNRTASKADPLAQIGAEVVTDKGAMAHCATVFTMVSTTDDLKEILFGAGGVLAGSARPQRVVDMSSISDTGSAEIRKGLTQAGVAYLSAPVSGNARV